MTSKTFNLLRSPEDGIYIEIASKPSAKLLEDSDRFCTYSLLDKEALLGHER